MPLCHSSRPAPATGQSTTPLAYSVVVLAEDDPVLRRTLSDFLASEGFLVKEAPDLSTLRDVLVDEASATLVLDMHLGTDDVRSVLSDLAQKENRPNIVLMSSSIAAARVAREHRLQLLQKPFDLDALVQALLVPLDERASDP
jgi:DNA-binding NtrC family response regulator